MNRFGSRLIGGVSVPAIAAVTACADPSAIDAPQKLTPPDVSADKQTPTSARILYIASANLGTNADLFTMDDDGTHIIQLSSGVYVNSASWAADGKRIL